MSHSQKLSIKRGGYAIVFIYIPLFIVLALIAKLLNTTNSYFFMSCSVLIVAVGYYLRPILFNRPVIEADVNGIYTSNLGKVEWTEIQEIYVVKEPIFSMRGLNNVDIYLHIKTRNNNTDKFDVMYLENGESSANLLVVFYEKTKV